MGQDDVVLPNGLSPELIEIVQQQAEKDAEAMIAHLRSIDVPLDNSMPAYLLFALGAIVQICEWERQGIYIHLRDGLPTAEFVLVDFKNRIKNIKFEDLRVFGTGLLKWVIDLRLSHLAWSGRQLMGGEVEISPVDEEQLVRALADLCWSCRLLGN